MERGSASRAGGESEDSSCKEKQDRRGLSLLLVIVKRKGWRIKEKST